MKNDKKWLVDGAKSEVNHWKHHRADEYARGRYVGAKEFLKAAKQLEELKQFELPIIPQFMADWLKICKSTGVSLFGSMNKEIIFHYYHKPKGEIGKIEKYFRDVSNQETFAMAWVINHYEIEKQPQWVVSFLDEDDEKFYFSEFYEMNEDVFTPNGHIDKTDTDVILFKDKSKAEAVAVLVDGEVEEA